tara:strand:- start:2311 stop:4065 length:1755 start_codon:yes stop_codon:yes gene_type:complete
MCGFFFYYNNDGDKLNIKQISELKKIQHKRGPDYAGFIKYKNCYFFHNRLKIIDLKNVSNQPMMCKKTGNVIIFNGEIYNFSNLKEKYLRDYKFFSKSDTEVILYLYEKLGYEFVRQLNGIFSFVIYDQKKNIIYIARDRFGVKPLNIYYDNKEIIFSSEIKPILYLKNNISINKRLVNQYLINGYIHHSTRTLFDKITTLDQAFYQIFDLNKFNFTKKQQYWKLKKNKSLHVKSADEFKKVYHEYFKNSLNLNITSDVDISMMLSSGFDSRFMYNKLEEFYEHKIKTFSFGWNDKKYDESQYVENNIIKSKSNHKTFKINLDNFLVDLEHMIKLSESPIGGLGSFGVFKMYESIQKQNIKVVLSGEGSDELNFGYINMHASYINEINDKTKQKKELNIFNEIYDENLSLDNLRNKYLKANLLTPDGKEMSNLNNSTTLSSNKIQNNYIKKYKLPKLLHFQDRAGGGYGIESRYPYLENDLVDFCFSNNNEYKIINGITKQHIRLNEDKRLTKKFVAAPQREFFKKNYKSIYEYIKNGNLKKLGLVDINEFEKLYHSYSKSNNLGNSFFAWKILNMEIFLNNFI